MLTNASLIAELLPDPPPCFKSRQQWQEYVLLGLATGERNHAPLVNPRQKGNGKRMGLRFNVNLDFCTDCRGVYRREMQQAGKCVPEWLRLDE